MDYFTEHIGNGNFHLLMLVDLNKPRDGATHKEIGDPHPRLEQDDLDRDIASIKAKIGSTAFEVAYDFGQGMTLDEVVALALGQRKQI